MFAICVEFLQGRVAAARTDNPTRLEWPIHPGRLFMAMVSACYESDGGQSELETLRWLESLDSPMIEAPAAYERLSSLDRDRAAPCTTFVVVNDAFGTKEDPLYRGKQPRTFASGYVGEGVLRYVFAADLDDVRSESLERLCESIVRIGHSSSLVRCWVETVLVDRIEQSGEDAEEHCESYQLWFPQDWSRDDRAGAAVLDQRSMRTVSAGTLDRLDRAFNWDAVQAYNELALVADVKPATKESKAAMKELKAKFPGAPRDCPMSVPPSINTYTGYRLLGPVQRLPSLRTDFDPAMIVLAIDDGNSVGLESSVPLIEALRGKILSDHDGPQPSWLTGHDADGTATAENHLAFVPLAHVGKATKVASDASRVWSTKLPQTQRKHGTKPRANIYDGHVMGLALVLPRGLSREQSGGAFAEMLYDDLGETKSIELVAGRVGEFLLSREQRSRPPIALNLDTWTKPSLIWASVTPVVLDRHPKNDAVKDPRGWRAEVTDTVIRSCGHVGIEADAIDTIRIGPHGMVSGVPSARPSRGFPLLPSTSNKPSRQQVHVVIQFKRPLTGPLILGAGRFRGYGFFKPVEVQS